MARKLYIFKPSGKVRTDDQRNSIKWLGSYTSTYTYLGDHYAKMLGVGYQQLPTRRIPAWISAQAAGARQVKGGASRHDPAFRGWG